MGVLAGRVRVMVRLGFLLRPMSLQGPLGCPAPSPLLFWTLAFNFPFCKAVLSECSLSSALLLPVETVTPRRENIFQALSGLGVDVRKSSSPGRPCSCLPQVAVQAGGLQPELWRRWRRGSCTGARPTGRDTDEEILPDTQQGCPAQSSRRPAA